MPAAAEPGGFAAAEGGFVDQEKLVMKWVFGKKLNETRLAMISHCLFEPMISHWLILTLSINPPAKQRERERLLFLPEKDTSFMKIKNKKQRIPQKCFPL